MKNNKTEPIPVMDYRQYRRARRLVHECCNYIDGNCIALDDGEECVCVQSSTEAERKRAARLQNKALSALRISGGHLSDIRPPEIEIELEKEIEIKREIEKVRPETGHPSHTYGHYQNVFLTDEESLVKGKNNSQ